ncbi:MAG: hypothetical protein FWF81_02690 [Defluviitaleaceae bacterium]|nr:hypothetical protein [Defluviitaleaceae bacterium]
MNSQTMSKEEMMAAISKNRKRRETEYMDNDPLNTDGQSYLKFILEGLELVESEEL